ncbi:MAG: hypothetical protein V8S08_06205 [Lachnoclostridium sp.]
MKIENSVSGKSLSMYVDSTSKVNELMLELIEEDLPLTMSLVIYREIMKDAFCVRMEM